MTQRLCITVRFLQPFYHGRGDAGRPEWPPSPLRLFQAMVAAAAARANERAALDRSVEALRWFEHLRAPVIIAPKGTTAKTGYRTYVPDNVGDLVARSWVRGGVAEIADIRVEKDVRPVQVDGEAVHFIYSVSDANQSHIAVLTKAARSLTHLGWGIDMVVGDLEFLTAEAAGKLDGQRWLPVPTDRGTSLRAPLPGTLDELISKHTAFLNRLASDDRGNESFHPVPPLSKFQTVTYRRATDPEPRQWAAFTLLKPDASARRSFNTVRRTRDVAGMLRNAVDRIATAQQWPKERIAIFVHGKTPDGSGPSRGEASPDRFQYLPLPTINSTLNRIESIRRVLIAAPPHCRGEIDWARRALAGSELTNDGEAMALLTILPGSDWVLKQYIGESTTWSTVTPVILPGFDDPDHLRRKLKTGCDAETQRRYLGRLDARMDELLRKAFRQAGYASELVDQLELDWRGTGFLPGVDLASRYLPPKNLDGSPRTHVRVRFPFPVRGPIAIGSGRFRGFGLFSKLDT